MENDNIRENVLRRFFRGEWVDCDDIERYLGIDFSTGLRLFEFGRKAFWNPAPLNGQYIVCRFRLKRDLVDTDFDFGLKLPEGLL